MRFFSKTTRATAGPRWFGIDLAKRESQVAVLDANGVQIETKRFATTRECFLLIAAELREGDTAALEVTTNSTSIARLLRGNSKARVIVSNPIKTKTIVDQRKRHSQDPSSPLIPSTDLVFDPTSPNETDWERILSQHSEKLLLRYQKRETKRSKSTPPPDIA